MELSVKKVSKNKFGQYFTPEVVADFMIGLADGSPEEMRVLEPSCGEGVFLKLLQQKGYTDLTAYEIDESLATNFPFVRHESFVSAEPDRKFDLIIGNPPYIRWKNLEEPLKAELAVNPLWNRYFNSLCDYLYLFILKSVEWLQEDGQLIFICPEYWMNTTHSASLRNYLVENGYFEAIYHFNETPIFDKATVSIIVFKFVKSRQKAGKIKVAKFYAPQKLTSGLLNDLKEQVPVKGAEYLEVSPFRPNERWLLQTDAVREELQMLEVACQREAIGTPDLFTAPGSAYDTIGDVCDIGNGLVSGLDKAFQFTGPSLTEHERAAAIGVVKAKDLVPYCVSGITPYLLIQEHLSEEAFQEQYPNFCQHLQPYRADLEKRYQYNRQIPYWEWVFLRNFALFSSGNRRIFVPCKERISNKAHFRFALVEAGVFPTQDVTALFRKSSTRESIEYILAYLNQPVVFNWLRCNGIVKGNIVEFSERPLASIPFRKIDWNCPEEACLHDVITGLVQQYLTQKDGALLPTINKQFDSLLK